MKKQLLATLCLVAVSPVLQADFKELIFDKEDGQLDVSPWLDTAWGFMPVAIPITEPAVGYGLAGAGIWFHDKMTTSPDGNVYLPAVSGLLGLATENGSRALGGFHTRVWDDDNWGYTGLVASGDINLQVRDADSDREFRYGLDGLLTSHELSRKIWGPLKASVEYQYSQFDIKFRELDLAFDNTDAGVLLGLDWNKLDNPLSPMQGYRLKLDYSDFNERWGGDNNYAKLKLDGRFHHQWEKWRIAARGLAEVADEDTPFYAMPFVNLRGVPAMAYIGDSVTSVEAELGYQFNYRWSAILFGGLGEANFEPIAGIPLVDDQRINAAGLGFRYRIARTYGLHAGIDIARNSEGDNAIYFQVGAGWR